MEMLIIDVEDAVEKLFRKGTKLEDSTKQHVAPPEIVQARSLFVSPRRQREQSMFCV